MISHLFWMGLSLTGCAWLEEIDGPDPVDLPEVTVEAEVVDAVLDEVVLPAEVELPSGFLEGTVLYEADLSANTVTRGVRRPATPTRGVD
ncbi:MAG: hypothetical protein AAF602_22040, partial [Myxococcota bacterium]